MTRTQVRDGSNLLGFGIQSPLKVTVITPTKQGTILVRVQLLEHTITAPKIGVCRFRQEVENNSYPFWLWSNHSFLIILRKVHPIFFCQKKSVTHAPP
mmetsp:Transcript_13168/g.13328  ORF Transcript_13168/g.13328 Transcript_13168/m.13328 type:complete len:98 (+) Transcript_13168:549-842(+)